MRLMIALGDVSALAFAVRAIETRSVVALAMCGLMFWAAGRLERAS